MEALPWIASAKCMFQAQFPLKYLSVTLDDGYFLGAYDALFLTLYAVSCNNILFGRDSEHKRMVDIHSLPSLRR